MEEPVTALTNLQILVVEDEVMIMIMLENLLEDFGCNVEIAPSIEKALEVVRVSPLDGVLLDMNIHGKTTIAVAEELVARSVPFLLVTGYAAGDSDPPVIKAAPRLQKPFNVEELRRRMVELFLDKADGRRTA